MLVSGEQTEIPSTVAFPIVVYDEKKKSIYFISHYFGIVYMYIHTQSWLCKELNAIGQ